MHQQFALFVEGLHPSFERLVEMDPCSNGSLPTAMPASGVYLFSEGERHLYVGRSRNIRRRYRLHTRPSAPHNQAGFAFLLAKEELSIGEPSYKADELSRKGLSKNADFMRAFQEEKKRVKEREFR